MKSLKATIREMRSRPPDNIDFVIGVVVSAVVASGSNVAFGVTFAIAGYLISRFLGTWLRKLTIEKNQN